MANEEGGVGSQAQAGADAAAKEAKAKAEAEAEAKAKAAAAPVEVKYDDLKVPEKSPLEKATVDELKAFAKEHKLSLESAQAILNRDNAAAISLQERQNKEWETLRAGWQKQVADDKQIGGEKLKESLELVKRCIKHYDKDGSFGKELETSGLGDHPAFIKFIHSIAKSGAEDRFVDGNPADQKPKQDSLEKRLSSLTPTAGVS
jgi:hypothetical protein